MPEQNPVGAWEQLLNVVEGLAVLDHSQDTAGLYPLVLTGINNEVVLTYGARLWQMVAGITGPARSSGWALVHLTVVRQD